MTLSNQEIIVADYGDGMEVRSINRAVVGK